MDTIASWIPLKLKDKRIKKTKLTFAISANMPYLENNEFVTKLQMHAFSLNLYRSKVVLTNNEIGKLAAIHFATDFGKKDDIDKELE